MGAADAAAIGCGCEIRGVSTCGSGRAIRRGSGTLSLLAGTAEPMITCAGELAPAAHRGPPLETESSEDSCRGPLLRAESAANGETFVEAMSWRSCGTAIFRVEPSPRGTTDGPTGALILEPPMEEAATSLSSCSIGSNRCACAILSRPSSRWKRCSCLYPSSL